MLAVVVSVLLAQTPEVLVASTARQGVSASSAGELAALVVQALQRFPAARAPSDLTPCKRKLPCLVSAAKKAQVAWLVGVETARVVDQVIVKVSLLSIDEDGRTVATAVAEGTEEQVRASLTGLVDSRLSPPLERAFPRPKPPPPPDPVPPPPPPTPVPVATSTPTTSVSTTLPPEPPPPSTLRTAGLVVGAVGAAGLVAAAVLGAVTIDTVAKRDARCPPASQCNDPTALLLHDRAALTQDVGIFLAAGAGAALVTGLVMFFVGAPARPPALGFFATPAGAGFTLSSPF